MRSLCLALLLVSLPLVAGAGEIAGVKLAERARLGGSELILNGAGLRKRAFFRVYVASLYLAEKRHLPAEVVALAGPKRISITLMRDLPAWRLVAGLREGIRQNASPEEQQALRGRVQALAANLLTLGQGKQSDVITLDWLPDAGTLVTLNGEVRGSAIPGEDFYRALLNVWLGDQPTSAALKAALLGRAN